MPRGACAELIALRCAVCLLMSNVPNGSTCDICGGGGNMGTERGQSTEESKKTSTQNTHINLVSVSYQVPGTTTTTSSCCCMFKRTHSAARHSTAKRRARHGPALRCAAELYIGVLNWAGGALFVIQEQRHLYKSGVVLIVPVRGMILRILLACTN